MVQLVQFKYVWCNWCNYDIYGAIGAIGAIIRQGKKMRSVTERESKTLEFKSKLPIFSNLIKTCVAFANGFGGKIIIGIDDKTRRLTGITDADRDRLYDEFTNSLYDSTSPTIFAHIFEKRYGNKAVLIIEIPPSPKKPYFVKTEGIPKGVYVRIGSNTRRASPDYIEELMREGSHTAFDEEAIHQSPSVLSKEWLKDFYGGRVTQNKLFADRIITPYPSRKEKHLPTVTGILLFAEKPHLYLPEATVLCSRFKGISGRQIIQSQELHGPIDILATDSLTLASSWMETNFKLDQVQLKGSLPIPKSALREGILNALLHRKYSIPGAVKIAIYDNRCEIFSPGCFPGVIDINSLGDGTTYLRNPNLVRLARKMGLVEKLGSGIRLIFDTCRKAGLKQPEYSESGDFVKLTFFFNPAKNTKQSDESIILALFTTREQIKVTDVMNVLGISRNTATRKLGALLQSEKLVRYGKGPAVVYLKA